MARSTGTARTVGRVGSLLCTAGVIAFFIGIFGGPRSLAFVGLALMAGSLVGFFVEEQIDRRA
jgi:ABC-type polysaccharide/polyol phosphate export permease